MSSRIVAINCIALALGLLACAVNPGTARTRRAMSEAEEIEIGRQAATEVEQYMGFAGSPELNAYVERIGQRLAKHSSRSELHYEFHVVDMKAPNAFALPGGHIYVSRGLLALLNSEDELATVLGHEIAHVAARHSAKSKAKSRAWIPLQVLAGIGGAATSIVSPGLGSAVAGVGQLPATLVLASYSRKQEAQADRLGQEYAADEGWDPAALASSMDALTREQELEGGRDPRQMSFFDSHPTTPDRSRDAREYAAKLEVASADRIAIARIVDEGQEINLFLTWIAKDGIVYRVLGATPVSRWNEHQPTFEASARSFHELSDHELREVHVHRLRLVKAQPGETLMAIAARSESQWTPEKMAVANDLSTSANLSGGESIKISKREPY